MVNLLRKKIKLKIPLSEIFYHSSEVMFQWNNIRLTVPYGNFPLKVPYGALFEEFKVSFQGEVAIYLECHRLSFHIEILDVKVTEDVLRKFTGVASHIEEVVEKIRSWASRDSLTFDLARTLLRHGGFEYDDNKTHRILAEIINSLPPEQITEKVPFPPSHLNYHSRGIQFLYKNVHYEVEKNKLPLEVGPAIEEIKTNFTGNITFHIDILYLRKWDPGQGQLHIGQVKQEVKAVEVNPYILQGFKAMRSQFISDSIKKLIEDASISTISIETVESLLKKWGLDLTHEETAQYVVSTIPPWTVEKDVNVPLKDVIYRDDAILVPIEGENMKIPGRNLPVKTDHQVEEFKHFIDGHINIHIYRPFQFVWDQADRQLAFDKKRAVKIKINIDEEAREQFKRVCWVYIEMGAEITPSGSSEDQTQPVGDEAVPAGEVEDAFPGKTRKEEILDLPRPVDKIPSAELTAGGYDAQFIRVLEDMAHKTYMTSKDLWFRIDNRLIWERPELRKATYIFEWPEEELEFFIAKIWASGLPDLRKDKEGTGYIGRVNHTPRDVSRWENNLKRILEKKVS